MKRTQRKNSILIVEDELPLLNVLSDKLTREGFFVLKATNGEEGLRSALQHLPDLILLDVLMPVMDGLTMMKKLREENAWGKKVPIIILTNLSPDEERITKSVADGEPAFYLVKTNWSLAQVVEKIQEILS